MNEGLEVGADEGVGRDSGGEKEFGALSLYHIWAKQMLYVDSREPQTALELKE